MSKSESEILDSAVLSPLTRRPTFLELLRAAAIEGHNAQRPTEPEDPWKAEIASMCGFVDQHGVERVTTATLMDALGVPPHRRQSASRRVARLMRQARWEATTITFAGRDGKRRQGRGWMRDICARKLQTEKLVHSSTQEQ